MTLFDGGKLKPGIYKIQNIVGETYLDIREHNKELCCRPDFVLGGKGQWIDGSRWESRYLCFYLPCGLEVEEVHDKHYMGYEYVRLGHPSHPSFFWGTSNLTWDLADYGSSNDRTPVHYKITGSRAPNCRVWKLTPVKLHAGFQPPILKADSPPEYRDKHE
ncbi:hypothetical protein BJ322DRAFT_1025852 [Thelephora terrestris]|uniref:Uncharacterized protein n=1 Tax=Thelephora terrestris TaxID=56493 RepID=A0A9P6H176_9AGAM|nr:hypothetical protein BJ322DRAFT_1025852 [Thelephora terrestris]